MSPLAGAVTEAALNNFGPVPQSLRQWTCFSTIRISGLPSLSERWTSCFTLAAQSRLMRPLFISLRLNAKALQGGHQGHCITLKSLLRISKRNRRLQMKLRRRFHHGRILAAQHQRI